MKAGSLLPLLPLVLLGMASAQEQDRSRVEVFGGYSYLDYSVYEQYSGPWTNHSFNGWESSGAFKVAPFVALEGDFSGGYGNDFGRSDSYFSYMGGPRVFADIHRVRLYGHALFGGMRFSAFGTDSSFAAALGGGADFWFSRHIGMRLIQADDLLNRSRASLGTDLGGPGPRSHLRISSGVTFRF